MSESLEVARKALTKINTIRNSIIGLQSINWSEHIYPLVAALDAAGMEGMSYPEARENFGTMLERTNAAEDEVARLTTALAEARAEGRRQGLEEAATHLEDRADYFNRSPGYREWDDAARSYRASAREVRKLRATTSTETQKPETGESR